MSDKVDYSESVKISIAGSRIMRVFSQYDVYKGEACFHFIAKGVEGKVPEGLTSGGEIEFIASIGRVSYHKPTVFMLGGKKLIKLHYSNIPSLGISSESFNKVVKLLQDAGVWIPNLSDEVIEEILGLHNEGPCKRGWKPIGEVSKPNPPSEPEVERKPYIQPVGWSMFIAVGLLGVVAGTLIGLAFS